MATNAPREGRGGDGERIGGRIAAGAPEAAGLVGVLAVVALVAIAIALFLMQGSMSKQNCIRKAEAQYPSVPVSAFVSGKNPGTGPLKVSFSKQRADAVSAC